MLHALGGFIERYGYLAVFLFVTAEGVGIPLPGETALVTAAAFAATGSLSIWGVIAAASMGALVGGSGGYWIGRTGGRDLLARYGHLVRMDDARLRRTEQYFAEHGAKTVFIARFVALLRIFGSLMAGAAGMSFATFTAVNLAGGVLWAAAFSALGYLFGRNLPALEHRLGLASAFLLAGALLALFLWYRRRRSRAAAGS